MKPRRTENSTDCLGLVGGTEDNSLWVQFVPHDTDVDENDPCYGNPAIQSVWELDDYERVKIAAGANIKLTVVGTGHPPVRMQITEEKLGRGTNH